MEPPKKTIAIVVEDDEAISDFFVQTLEAEGFEVHVARNGLEGLKMIQTDQPAAVLLDLALPEMDGLTVLRKLGDAPETSTIPVVVVSAYADADDTRTVLDHSRNVRKVFTKPVRTEDLLKQVRSIVAGR